MKTTNPKHIDEEIMVEIATKFYEIAQQYNLEINTCSEKIDLSSIGIKYAKCIDDKLISSIVGCKLNIGKDKNQRDICGCVSSIDIGAYNTCKHGCLYCYANYSDTAVINNTSNHFENSPFLIGQETKDDKKTIRKMESYIKNEQLSFF